MREKRNKYIQYGCGHIAPEGWRNFDASPTLCFEKIPVIGRLYTKNLKRFPKNVEYGNIVKGFPVPDDFCDGVYCSHTLEHLTLQELRLALANTYKIISPGGVFRLVMPDLELLARAYLQDDRPGAAIEFMRQAGMGVENRKRSLVGFIYEWLRHDRHLWLWDFKSIKVELETAGFRDVRRACNGDSLEKKFIEVEEGHRWRGQLGVECRK